MADRIEPFVMEKSAQSSRSTNFRVVEAYRQIRTNLLFSLGDNPNRVVLISSAEPSAGKSTTCTNLAIVMAQNGSRVLLIDADMRKPMQHRHFRLKKTDGLSKMLSGIATEEESLHKQVMPNLDVLLSGSIPPNPSELLGGERMKAFLQKANSQYDFVIVDTPPLNVVTDASVLAPITAGVMLIARYRQTTYDEIAEAKERLEQIHANFLGVVISDVATDREGYYNHYGRYGRKYYYQNYNYRYGQNNDHEK